MQNSIHTHVINKCAKAFKLHFYMLSCFNLVECLKKVGFADFAPVGHNRWTVVYVMSVEYVWVKCEPTLLCNYI